jgi:hypothetical protein
MIGSRLPDDMAVNQTRKKLLVILGAGSSASFGLPLVTALDPLILEWAKEWSDTEKDADYYAALSLNLERYCASGAQTNAPQPNFERVLGEMVSLAHWLSPAPYGDSLRELVAPNVPLPQFGCARHGTAIGAESQLVHLLARLASHMRGLSAKLDVGIPAFQDYVDLIAALLEEFELGIFNLNYDDVALRAFPDAFTGFDRTGTFNPIEVHTRSRWDFIYHLHGSVHHTLVRPFGRSIRWETNLDGPFDDCPEGLSRDDRPEAGPFPRTTLVAGGFKPHQLLIEPFQSFYAALVRHAYQADAILIGGYGFGDEHVNRALENRLKRQGPRPAILVLSWAKVGEDSIEASVDSWGRHVTSLFGANSDFFEPGTHSPPSVRDLQIRKSFEVNHDARVAIWYGGFSAASARRVGITHWLSGADDASLIAHFTPGASHNGGE